MKAWPTKETFAPRTKKSGCFLRSIQTRQDDTDISQYFLMPSEVDRLPDEAPSLFRNLIAHPENNFGEGLRQQHFKLNGLQGQKSLFEEVVRYFLFGEF